MGAGGTPQPGRAAATDVPELPAQPGEGGTTQLRLVREYAEAAGLTSVGAVAGPPARRSGRWSPLATARGSTFRCQQRRRRRGTSSVTAHRRFAMRSASLDNIKRLKDATGGTVNDVVMAICAGALRAYLTEHNALTDRPLRAMVPVSIRTGEEEDVDEPGVRSRCRPANPPRRSARTGGPVPEAMLGESSSSSWCRRRR